MDVIDRANDLAAEDLAHRIAAATRAKPRGPAECDDCGDAISDLRRDLGARLCLHCQSAQEHRAGSGRRA